MDNLSRHGLAERGFNLLRNNGFKEAKSSDEGVKGRLNAYLISTRTWLEVFIRQVELFDAKGTIAGKEILSAKIEQVFEGVRKDNRVETKLTTTRHHHRLLCHFVHGMT